MLRSHVITINGTFVGAAVRLDSGYRFIAIDLRLHELEETIWPSLAQIERLARRLFLTGGLGADRCETLPDGDPASQVGG